MVEVSEGLLAQLQLGRWKEMAMRMEKLEGQAMMPMLNGERQRIHGHAIDLDHCKHPFDCPVEAE